MQATDITTFFFTKKGIYDSPIAFRIFHENEIEHVHRIKVP